MSPILLLMLSKLKWINPFHATCPFRYSLKTENLWFSDVFRGYRKRPVAWNGLINFFSPWNISLKSISLRHDCKFAENNIYGVIQEWNVRMKFFNRFTFRLGSNQSGSFKIALKSSSLFFYWWLLQFHITTLFSSIFVFLILSNSGLQ